MTEASPASSSRRRWVKIRCWWGPDFRDVWLTRVDLHSLLMDGGDAHWQQRVGQ